MNDAELAHLARLARLHLEDDERETVRADLERVLDYLGDLASIDVDGLEPMLRPVHVEDGTRLDEVRHGLDPETGRNLAQEREDAFIKVPRTAGDDG